MKEKKIEKEEKTKSKSLDKIVKSVIVIIAILILLFFAADKFGNITFSSVGDYFRGIASGAKRGGGYPYYFENTNAQDVKKINNELLVLTNNETYVLDSTARKNSELGHSYSTPLVDSCGGRAIMFDVGANNYRVQSKSKVLYEAQTENKILTSCIGTNGTVAMATRGTGAVSQLTVYNSNRKEIFKWSCSKETIVSVDVSDNGKRICTAVVGAENGELYSKVFIFDTDYAEPVYESNFGAQIVSGVEFIQGYNVIVSGENIMSFINKKYERNDIDLSLNTLSRIYTGENNTTAVILSRYGSSSSKILKVYDKNGTELFSVDIDCSVRSVCCEGGYISVLTDKQLLNYNRSGKLVGSADVSSDGIECFTNGNTTYVVTTSSINSYKTTGENKPKNK